MMSYENNNVFEELRGLCTKETENDTLTKFTSDMLVTKMSSHKFIERAFGDFISHSKSCC